MSTSLLTVWLLTALKFVTLQSASGENYTAIVEVGVTACYGWEYGSSSNTLQLQLKGKYDSSQFFYVNQFGPLPVNGYTDIFMVELILNEDIRYFDELFSVMLSLSDSFGYCLKNLTIKMYGATNDMYYVYDEEWFGLGLIISHQCQYSYKSISKHLPLLRCYDDYLELYAMYPRGIYKLVVHSCNNNRTKGIDAKSMEDNVYTTLVGKHTGTNYYETQDWEYLDHYAVGNINVKYLGHIIGGNVIIPQQYPHGYPLYTRHVTGTIIGIKIEPVDEEKYDNYDNNNNDGKNNQNKNDYGDYNLFDENDVDELGIIINGKRRKIHSSMLLGMGKYLVTFLDFHDRVKVKKEQSAEIMIYGNIGHIYVNVYVIFEEYTHLYQLPWIINNEPAPKSVTRKYSNNSRKEEDTNNGHDEVKESGIDWFDAHKQCMSLYGTSLTSIHSKDEAFLMEGFVGYNEAWIGFFDFDINHRFQMNNDGVCYINNFNDNYQCQWRWIDGSSVDYVFWRNDLYHSYSFEDCAYIDGKRGGGWNNADCHSLKISKYVCSSPYWFINSVRKFELNLNDPVPEISMISIGNDNSNYPLCIDSISLYTFFEHAYDVNITNANLNVSHIKMDHVVLEMTNNWIGGGFDLYLNGIIKYPVCKTEVVGLNILYETSKSVFIKPMAKIPGGSCVTEQRVDDEERITYCLTNQDYIIGRKTVFRISSDYMDDVSFASESRVGLTTTHTINTTNIFRFDQRYSVNFAQNINGTVNITRIKPLILRPDQRWHDIEENVNFIPYDDEYIIYDKQQYESVSPVIIQCSGKSYIPTSHILPFEYTVNQIKIQIDTRATLRLTLCQEFLNTNHSKVIYKTNIPTQLFHLEAIGCDINWLQPKYIPNTNETSDCSQQQIISINMNLDYLPNCNSNNIKLYDGCQCTSDICWCSDQYGNKIDSSLIMKIPNNATWQQTCRIYLNCSNTQVIL